MRLQICRTARINIGDLSKRIGKTMIVIGRNDSSITDFGVNQFSEHCPAVMTVDERVAGFVVGLRRNGSKMCLVF